MVSRWPAHGWLCRNSRTPTLTSLWFMNDRNASAQTCASQAPHEWADPPSIPGVNPSTVQAAGIRRISAEEALKVFNQYESGIVFPYFDLDGQAILDRDEPFSRLRTDDTCDGKLYHRSYEAPAFPYLPPHLRNSSTRFGQPIVVVEREEQTLALCDSGHFRALGLNDVDAYGYPDSEFPFPLGQQLDKVLDCNPSASIYFGGDKDTLFNAFFYSAALNFRIVFKRRVHLMQVPLDAAGNGFDECRATMGAERFSDFAIDLASPLHAIEVGEKTSAGRLAVASIRRQQKAIKHASEDDDERHTMLDRLIGLCAGLRILNDYLSEEDLVRFAEEHLGAKRRALKNAIKDKVIAMQAELPSQTPADTSETTIHKDAPTGVWTKKVVEVLGPVTYFRAGQFCDVKGDSVESYDAASLACFTDQPERCQFVRKGKNGLSPSPLTESEAKLIIGAARLHRDLVRPIKVLAKVPALVWDGMEARVVSGYDRRLEIHAEGTIAELPTVPEAVTLVLELLQDFQFPTPFDKARAVAFLLAPCLARSGILGEGGRVPFFFVTKDQRAAGAGFLAKVVAAVYGMKPKAVSLLKSNPERCKEGISKALCGGNALIYLDNVTKNDLRDLSFLESLLTEPFFEARAPYIQAELDVTAEVFAGTSNGAVLSDDLASRTCLIRICKRPDSYLFRTWEEGGLIDHIVAARPQILAAVYSLVIEYAQKGHSTGGRMTGFRFSAWERATSWILEHCFAQGLFEDDYKMMQDSMSDPNYDLLISLLRAVAKRRPGEEVTARDIAEIGNSEGVFNEEQDSGPLFVGKLLKRHFDSDGVRVLGGIFRITRISKKSPTSNYEALKWYRVELIGAATAHDTTAQTT